MPNEKNIQVTTESDLEPQYIFNSQTEINDLIGNPPGWLLRSGIGMVAIVCFLILGGSYFFKYPDKLTGVGLITSTTPPIEVISRTTGYIDVIHVAEGDVLKKGDSIIYINNTTDKKQLIQLQNWIENYEKIEDSRKIVNLPFVENLQLGSIQSDYAMLQLRYNELQLNLKDGVVFEQINNLSREIDKIKTLNKSQQRERALYAQELDLSKKDFKRNEGLKKDGVVSELDMEKSKTVLLQRERQFEGMNNSIIQNNIRIEQLELEKLKLKEQRSKAINGYLFTISEIISRIRSSIANWNKTYSISAPIDGKITYAKGITLKKNLNQGETIGYIIPHEDETNYVSAIYPSYNIGKVEANQKVIIKFDAYPHKEYGVVISEVKEISKMPEVNKAGEPLYEVKIHLDDVIVTDYNDTIRYNPRMTVVTEIITEDKTVFERLFSQLISLVNQS